MRFESSHKKGIASFGKTKVVDLNLHIAPKEEGGGSEEGTWCAYFMPSYICMFFKITMEKQTRDVFN